MVFAVSGESPAGNCRQGGNAADVLVADGEVNLRPEFEQLLLGVIVKTAYCLVQVVYVVPDPCFRKRLASTALSARGSFRRRTGWQRRPLRFSFLVLRCHC